MDENGSSDKRIRFGDGDAQSIPAEWAEGMLRYLFAHSQRAFGDALMAAIDLHLPARGRPKVEAQ